MSTGRRFVRVGAVVATLAIVAGIAGACSSSATTAPTNQPATQPPASAAASQAGPWKVAFMAGQVGIPFYTSVECGARTAAKQFNVDLNYQGPTDWDINKQMPFIDAAKQIDPQGWVISPTDGGTLIPMIKDLMAKKVPVVTIDAPLNEPVELQSIQSNHYGGGQAAAKAMTGLTGGKGKYVVVGNTPGLPDIDARVKGFVDDMTKAGAEVLPVLQPGTDSTKAAEMVGAAIKANPDLVGIYVTHSAAAQGASAAILEAGQQGKIKLVAFDADPQQIRDLKANVYDALIAQLPYQMGYESVKLVAGVLGGSVDMTTVKHDNPTDFAILTRDNVDKPENAKFLYIGDMSQCDAMSKGQ
jgi:ribose transport system substrate-binding protein